MIKGQKSVRDGIEKNKEQLNVSFFIEWKVITNFPKYEINNQGDIRRYNKASEYDKRVSKYTYLKPQKTKSGYLQITLYKNKKTYRKSIHRLVAETFIPNINDLPEVNHKDEDKTNNNIKNLEWCTSKYNNNYGSHKQNVANSHKKKIIQLDRKGNFLFLYDGIVSAGLENNIDTSSISKCCLGKRKTAGGYLWRYAKEVIV